MRQAPLLVLAWVLLLAGCTAGSGVSAEPSRAGRSSVAVAAPLSTRVITPPRDGWRWESYRTIEFQVPQDWGWWRRTTPLSWSDCNGWGGPLRVPGTVNREFGPQTAQACDGPEQVRHWYTPGIDLDVQHRQGGADRSSVVEHGDGWVTRTVVAPVRRSRYRTTTP